MGICVILSVFDWRIGKSSIFAAEKQRGAVGKTAEIIPYNLIQVMLA